ncbi:MAG: L-serine ammonia-lyase, iron-sulfur-dependent, subunit alpha [Desulfobacca sp.]|nr:L-serine ammonia-lyase, iron-sulfur-dependent, subunit alpha [Desulfobacca sp.]
MSFAIKSLLHDRAQALIHLETEPGLGCTDPAALGLCAAAAAALLPGQDFDSIEVTLDPNLYKNALRVIIPGTGGKGGIALAAALGALAGDPNLNLQVFSTVDAAALEQAQQLLNTGKVSTAILEGQVGLYVQTVISAGGHTAAATIIGQHDHIVSLTLDGQPQENHPLLRRVAEPDKGIADLERWLMGRSLGELVGLLDELDPDDLDYIQQGIDMNQVLAAYGREHGPGLGVGQALERLVHQGLIHRDLVVEAGILTAAAIDARMAGIMLPAMTLAGSGNLGLAASLPLVAASNFTGDGDRPRLLRAVTLSYLMACYITAQVGRLSALCSSSVAGGAGVAAGVTYLQGGTVDQIGGAITNHLATVALVICDGAKTSCALKVSSAVMAAVRNALLALAGTVVRADDGFVGATPEATIRHLVKLSREGLSPMDTALLDIMLHPELDG